MSYLYVKSDGTADGTTNGVFATQQTGSFATLGAANYYSHYATAITRATAGDTICVSYANSDSSGTTTTGTVPAVSFGKTTNVICVSDSNIDEQVDGRTSANNQISVGLVSNKGSFYFDKLNIECTNYWRVQESSSLITFNECDITLASSYFYPDGNNQRWAFINCNIIHSGTSADLFRWQRGSLLNVVGGSILSTGTLESICGTLDFYGSHYHFDGVDMSSSGASYFLANIGAGGVSDDWQDVNLSKCKLPSLTGWSEEVFDNPAHQIKVIGSAASDAACAYQFAYVGYGVEINETTTVYRTSTDAVFDTTKISAHATTTANITDNEIVRWKLPWGRYADLSAAGSDTIKIQFAVGSGTLTPEEIWFDVVYQDRTNSGKYNTATNKPDDIYGSTTYTTTTSEWTGTLAAEYEVNIDLSDGGPCVPEIWVNIVKASSNIYIDPLPTFI